MTDRELIQQALESLQTVLGYRQTFLDIHQVVEDLKARLTQPEPEPVAWTTDLDFDYDTEIIPAYKKGKVGTNNIDIPLYTKQPQQIKQNPIAWRWKDIYDYTAQPQRKEEPEPVAQVNYNERQNIAWLFGKQLPDGTLLYTAPPQREWHGLTDEEMFAALVQVDPLTKRLAPGFEYFARAIEAKLKEKNETNK